MSHDALKITDPEKEIPTTWRCAPVDSVRRGSRDKQVRETGGFVLVQKERGAGEGGLGWGERLPERDGAFGSGFLRKKKKRKESLVCFSGYGGCTRKNSEFLKTREKRVRRGSRTSMCT